MSLWLSWKLLQKLTCEGREPMSTPHEPKPPVPFAVRCHQEFDETEAVHPGWIRATAILLRGLARLKEQEETSSRQ